MGDAGYYLSAFALFNIAKQAAIRAAAGTSLQDNVIIAIVFPDLGNDCISQLVK